MFRRVKNQVLYVVPPFAVAYYAMQWSIERYVILDTRENTRPIADADNDAGTSISTRKLDALNLLRMKNDFSFVSDAPEIVDTVERNQVRGAVYKSSFQMEIEPCRVPSTPGQSFGRLRT